MSKRRIEDALAATDQVAQPAAAPGNGSDQPQPPRYFYQVICTDEYGRTEEVCRKPTIGQARKWVSENCLLMSKIYLRVDICRCKAVLSLSLRAKAV